MRLAGLDYQALPQCRLLDVAHSSGQEPSGQSCAELAACMCLMGGHLLLQACALPLADLQVVCLQGIGNALLASVLSVGLIAAVLAAVE